MLLVLLSWELRKISPEPPGFSPNVGWRASLDKFGYTIIPEVLNKSEIHTANEMLYGWLDHISDHKFVRNDTSTWGNIPGLSQGNGVLGGMGAGQTDFMWFVRTRPKIRKVTVQI